MNSIFWQKIDLLDDLGEWILLGQNLEIGQIEAEDVHHFIEEVAGEGVVGGFVNDADIETSVGFCV